jgi:glycosyltransferase involved in cell wall biosynthesis
MGRTDRLGHAFAESSIFALSSVREGMPMVILEAMSKGLPVVSFDCPTGPAELIETGHNGVLVPDGNIQALSAALQQVIEDDDLRLRLAKGAFETSGQYAGNVIGKRWVELVENLRAGRAGAQLSAGR